MNGSPNAELLKAIGRVQERLGVLPSDATNTFTKKEYGSSDMIREELCRRLRECGLLLTWTSTGVEFVSSDETYQDKQGNHRAATKRYVKAECDITLTHEETGQSRTDHAIGVSEGWKGTDLQGAFTFAFRNWAINAFLLRFADHETDDNGEPYDRKAADQAFKSQLKALQNCEPRKGAAKEMFLKILAHYKRPSGGPVEDPAEFKTRADAKSALAAMREMIERWKKQQFEDEADLVNEHRSAKKHKPEPLEVTDDDIPDFTPEPLRSTDFHEHGSTVIAYIRAKHEAKDPAGWLRSYDPAAKDQLLAEALDWSKESRR